MRQAQGLGPQGPCRCENHYCACTVDQSLTGYNLPGVAIRSNPPSCPHSAGVSIPGDCNWKKKSPHPKMGDSRSLRFSKRLLCPQLIKAAKQSHPKSVLRNFLSSVLPPLCLSISLTKLGNFSGVASRLLSQGTQELGTGTRLLPNCSLVVSTHLSQRHLSKCKCIQTTPTLFALFS